jgi:TonB family protein
MDGVLIKLLFFLDRVDGTVRQWKRACRRMLLRWLVACPPVIRRLLVKPTVRQKAIVKVALLHVAILIFFAIGLHFHFVKPSQEIEVTLGGPIGDSDVSKPAKLVAPELPTFVQPDIPPDMTVDANIAAEAAGSPNVTKPAEAIAEAHAFPKLPLRMQSAKVSPVRLLVTIAQNGQVINAQVQTSSGAPEIDAMAIDWVLKYWRYRPAMRNGQAVVETTMAIVQFLAG